MKEKTRKLLTLLLLALAIIATIFAIIFAMNVKNNPDSATFDIAYWMMIIMMVFSIAAIVVFLVKKLAGRFKEEPGYLKKFLFLCLLIVVVLVVSYLISTGNDIDIVKYKITEGTSKLVGAACIISYILVIGAALAIVVSEVMPKSNKKK